MSIDCGAGGVPVKLILPVIVPSSPFGAQALAVVSPPLLSPESPPSFFPPQAKLSERSETINDIASQKLARFLNILKSSKQDKFQITFRDYTNEILYRRTGAEGERARRAFLVSTLPLAWLLERRAATACAVLRA